MSDPETSSSPQTPGPDRQTTPPPDGHAKHEPPKSAPTLQAESKRTADRADPTVLLQGIADATRLLTSLDVKEPEVLASIEILRQAAGADRVCIQVTDGAPLNAGTPLLQRCIGVDRWTSTFQPSTRWRRILSSHTYVHECVSDLPADERAALAEEKVEVVLSLPVTAESVPRGCLRFDRMQFSAGWPAHEIIALETAANAYGSALGRIEALAKLKDSEARFRRLVENSPDFIYRMSLPSGRYEYASPAASEILGYEPEHILETPMQVREAIHPGWRGYLEAQWERLSRGDVSPTYEFAIVHGRTGETRWLFQRNVLIRDSDGKPIAFEGIVSDITARKRAELLLRTQQSMLESLFKAAPVGIAVISDRVILRVNDRFCRMTGYPREDLIGTSCRTLYATEEDYEHVGKEAYGRLPEYDIAAAETRWQRQDGTIVNVLLSATPMDPQDLAAGITITALDISQRIEAEAKLKRLIQERDAQIEELGGHAQTGLPE